MYSNIVPDFIISMYAADHVILTFWDSISLLGFPLLFNGIPQAGGDIPINRKQRSEGKAENY